MNNIRYLEEMPARSPTYYRMSVPQDGLTIQSEREGKKYELIRMDRKLAFADYTQLFLKAVATTLLCLFTLGLFGPGLRNIKSWFKGQVDEKKREYVYLKEPIETTSSTAKTDTAYKNILQPEQPKEEQSKPSGPQKLVKQPTNQPTVKVDQIDEDQIDEDLLLKIAMEESEETQKQAAAKLKADLVYQLPIEGRPQASWTVILAENNFNQYQPNAAGEVIGNSACTPLACRFLANNCLATPQALKDLILNLVNNNPYEKGVHVDTEQAIKDHQLSHTATLPMNIDEHGLPHEILIQELANFEIQNSNKKSPACRAMLELLQANKELDGAVMTTLGATIAMRKVKNTKQIEFFDPHGDNNITGKGQAAYIVRCNNLEDAVSYVHKKCFVELDNDGFEMGAAALSIYPVHTS